MWTQKKDERAAGLVQPRLPDLPPLPRREDSSDELEEEIDAKRLGSTSTTPRSEPVRARDPSDYDKIMGINSVGPFSEKGEAREVDDVDNQPRKPLTSSIPRLNSDSGVGVLGKV